MRIGHFVRAASIAGVAAGCMIANGGVRPAESRTAAASSGFVDSIPESAMLSLIGGGLLSLGLWRRGAFTRRHAKTFFSRLRIGSRKEAGTIGL
jgi:hypothetical protein